jgi:putative peptide zinc metalloprotease protein
VHLKFFNESMTDSLTTIADDACETNTVSQAVSSPLTWRQRADLIIRQQDSGAWIVKDPLSLHYVLLNEHEMAVLRMLDGTCSLHEVLQQLRRAWPGENLQAHDVKDLMHQLIQSQLVISTASHATANHRPVSPSQRRSISPRAGLGNILRMQLPLVDPSAFLRRWSPLIALLFSRTMSVVFLVVIAVALLMVTLRFGQLNDSLPGLWEFFAAENLLLLTISFVFVKALHEVGHAMAAQRYGAECHEAGIMLMLATPILYTNVTDAWILDRRSRMMITASGMLAEMLLAAVATILWFFAAPGIIKTLLTNVMVLCTVGTVLFNGNPLLRFDGYFLLTDAIGEANLSHRATVRVQRFLETLLLGHRSLPKETGSWFLLSYGLAAAVYRALLTVTILLFLFHLFDRWNLRIAGMAVALFVGVLLIVPAVRNAASGIAFEMFQGPNKVRRVVRAFMILTGVVVCLCIPLPCSVLVPGTVEPAGTPLFSTLSGRLTEAADYGQMLNPGDTVAVTANAELERQRTRWLGEVRVQESRVRAMELNRGVDPAAALPEARSLLAASVRRLEQFDQELSRLVIRSPARGLLMPPRATRNLSDEYSLSSWLDEPLTSVNVGAEITEGTVLGFVCDPEIVDVLMTLTNEEREQIQSGQLAEFQPTGHPGLALVGSIQDVASLDVTELPMELTAAGLLAPLRSGHQGEKERRWQAVFRATIGPRTSNAVSPPPLYSTGLIRVQVEPRSIVDRVARFLSASFR